MKLRNTIAKVIALTFFALIISGAPLLSSQGTTIYAQDAKPAPCNPDAAASPCKKSDSFNLGVKFSNPLKVNTIQDAIKLFVNAIVRISIPIIVIFFLWSGLSFIFARGNPEKITKARNMFFYTIIGTLLILGAWTITNAIIGTVNSITS